MDNHRLMSIPTGRAVVLVQGLGAEDMQSRLGIVFKQSEVASLDPTIQRPQRRPDTGATHAAFKHQHHVESG